MSNVAQGASALVPSESNFGGLTKRLLALRAEIDAILGELGGQGTAMPAEVTEPAPALTPAEQPAATADDDFLSVWFDSLTDNELKFEPCGTAEQAEASSETSATAAPEHPIAEPIVLQPSEAEQAPGACAVTALADPMPITAIDTHADGPVDDAGTFPEAEVAPAADESQAIAATNVAITDQPRDAAVLDAPQQSTPDPTASEAPQLEPAAQVDSGVATADDAQAADNSIPTAAPANAVADATVISLHARQKKHKGRLEAAAPAPMRSGRRLAAKIAASILVLLTTATILVIADRNAFGSVQSLPWMTPTPSAPTGIEWLLERLRAITTPSPDEAAPASDLPLDDGPLAGRMGWGA